MISVTFDPQEHRWWTFIPCKVCGGYRHDLPLSDPQQESEANFYAHAAHAYPGCLACESAQAQADERAGTRVRWDALTREWLLPVNGLAEGAALPLGVRRPDARDAAEAEAELLLRDSPLPLHIVEDGGRGDHDLPYLARNEDGHFDLWLPCFECGGELLPLRSTVLASAVHEALCAFAWLSTDGCPGCRHAPAPDELKAPGVWFDTTIGDWMIALPDSAEGTFAVTPLCLHSYGASAQRVAAAATSVLIAARTGAS